MYPKKKTPEGKIGEQSMNGIMVRYDDIDGTKAYRIFVPSIRKIVITSDVTFMDFKTTTEKVPDINILTDRLYGSCTSHPEKS